MEFYEGKVTSFFCNTVNSTLTLLDCKPTGLLQIEFFVDSVMAHILISNRLCAHVHVQMRRSKFYAHPRPRGFQCLSFVICMFSIFIVLPSVHASVWVGLKCCVPHQLLVKRKCQNDSEMNRPLSFFSNPNDGSKLRVWLRGLPRVMKNFFEKISVQETSNRFVSS